MDVIVKVLNTVKRNPIQITSVLTILLMIAQQILADSRIGIDDWGTYLITLIMSYVARSFTVPANEHQEVMDNLYNLKSVNRIGDGS